jgi:haloalkane dehalogenase
VDGVILYRQLQHGARALSDLIIDAADPHRRNRAKVLDAEISYVDVGAGNPIVLLHGNPTSSYLWRNVIPQLSGLGRVLAPDLVGFGASSKSPGRGYRFTGHVRYLDAWFESLNLTRDVTLVLHDWGTALGFHRATRFPSQVTAIVHMEAIAMVRKWADFGPAADIFRALRTEKGEQMVLDNNYFVEQRLPAGVLRTLSAEEMATYRAPFKTREDRLPTLVLPREIPIDGEPADVSAIVDAYGAWLAQSTIPKLLILAEGGVLTGRGRDLARTWPNQRELTVKARHYMQEDVPDEIGVAIADFVRSLASAPV